MSRLKRRQLLFNAAQEIGALIAATSLSACAYGNRATRGAAATSAAMPTPTRVSTPRPADPYIRGVVVDRVPTVAHSVRESTLIVIATVRRVLPARWTTPDGQRPANPHSAPFTIVTPVILEIERVLKGQSSTSLLYLSGSGGKVDRDVLDYTGVFTTAQVGDRLILFLRESLLWNLRIEGAIPWAVFDHYTISEGNLVATQGQTLPLQQFLDQIAAAMLKEAATPVP